MKTKTWIKNIALTSVLAIGITQIVAAQETEPQQAIQIFDGNGQPVNPRSIAVPTPDELHPTANASGGVWVQNENGKITITDAKGNEQEINIPGAKSVSINRSTQTIIRDGVKKTEMTGTAIIIGPDGTRHEIDLSGPINSDPLPNSFNKESEQRSNFMIGASCTPVSDALASQLNLETGVGLIVRSVAVDSPAARAGLQVHDILMYADDTQLISVEDLFVAIARVGKEKNQLSLTLIRAGQEMSVVVEPIEGPEIVPRELFGDVRGPFAPDQNEGLPRRFRDLGQGVIFGPDFGEEFHQQMQQQMQEMHFEMERMNQMMDEQLGEGNQRD